MFFFKVDYLFQDLKRRSPRVTRGQCSVPIIWGIKGNKLGRKEEEGLYTFTLQDLPYIALI
jgi:hypothetical protein